jgi:hypothetical protein
VIPQLPSCNDENFHEERQMHLCLCGCQPVMNVIAVCPIETNSLPTRLGKTTAKK